MSKRILKELRIHMPFTLFGALTGIVIMAVFYPFPPDILYRLFYVLHPTHVFLSALATASMFHLRRTETAGKRPDFKAVFLVGYVGAVAIGTLSDSLIPYLGEALLDMPAHEVHLGFIEEWWIVNPAAFAGILIGYFRPMTKNPHGGHVLVSTWASVFHVLMAVGGTLSPFLSLMIFVLLFTAVWVPCCLSDIVFPLLFVKDEEKIKHFSCCRHHK